MATPSANPNNPPTARRLAGHTSGRPASIYLSIYLS